MTTNQYPCPPSDDRLDGFGVSVSVSPVTIGSEEFPAGQWDYQLFYQENFDKARAGFEANIKALKVEDQMTQTLLNIVG